MKARVGDKVRIKSSQSRGVVSAIDDESMTIALDMGGSKKADSSEITNYSLAARKAWEAMPERRVGRPKGTKKTDRISVTLRIDRELWVRFQQAEQNGLISDRTRLINQCIAAKLDEVEDK